MPWLDLLLPVDCAGCGRSRAMLCTQCRGTLTDPPRPAWPTPCPAGMPPPWAVGDYDGAVRQLLLAYKERGASGLRRPLGEALARAVAAAAGDLPPGRSVTVVPVPSTRAAIRERGDDVVLELARVAAAGVRRAGCDARVLPALSHVRRVRDSAGLGAADRASNLRGALAVRPSAQRRVAGATVVLVDDLVTTGATLVEAARSLRGSGGVVVGAATVAATRRRGTTVTGRT